jgi:hypothetical protein
MGSPRPAVADDNEICLDISDAQEVAMCLQQRDLLKKAAVVDQQRIANLEKENENLKKELELKDRVIAIEQMEIDATRRALNDMKDVSDRAIKLAESKKSNLWETMGPLAIVAIIITVIATAL